MVKNGVPYNSEAGLKIGEEITQFVREKIIEASEELAEKRGPFPLFEKSTYHKEGKKPIRNTAPTTIAPTGTISIIAGCSSGIEPLFAISYVKNVMDNTKLYYGNEDFERIGLQEGWLTDDVRSKIAKNHGSVQGIDEVPEAYQKVFVTAHDIMPEDHAKMQGAVQKHIDNAVSKTINLGENMTESDVEQAYILAFRYGAKGVTIYRDKSKSEFEDQVIQYGQTKGAPALHLRKKTGLASVEWAPLLFPRNDPGVPAQSYTREYLIEGGPNLFLTPSFNKDGILNQIFMARGKSGGDESANSEAKAKELSIGLQHGVPPQTYIKALEGIKSDVHPVIIVKEEGKDDKFVKLPSIESAIAYEFREYLISRGMNPSDLSPEGYARMMFPPEDEAVGILRELTFPDGQPTVSLHMFENSKGMLNKTFLFRGESGQHQNAHFEALGKINSINLCYGINPSTLVNLLSGIQSKATTWGKGANFKSIEDFMSYHMGEWLIQRGIDPYKEKSGISKIIGENTQTNGNGISEFLKPPCPACGARVYEIIPQGRSCRIYTCCNGSAGSCE
ncbi:hypothetical protein KY308_02415 [Candidatus Woesearchaeota archaeon]|nr:hypothetical protein [Candidatus Woesearchaeota archaeon]